MSRMGRGNGMRADEADAILAVVAAGKPIPVAAGLAGWTDRTFYRYAKAHPEFRARLDEALVRPPTPIPHGTNRGYDRGCREKCCRAAHAKRHLDWLHRTGRCRCRDAVAA